eukprot:GHVP01053507.1.p1 GENE.GHVP01053507.1~~GHVP01053507.1.p1  ORF type:complete len:435 (+),score=62.84 GHVP01053507.1:97-1305(+)
MCGYAAHNKKDQNFVVDVLVVIFGDTLFAFVAGFVVFSIAGSLAHLNGVPLESLPLSGPSLIFETYPVGLAVVPYPGAQILSFFFFMTLFLLGFSTCVGCAEAIVMSLMGSDRLMKAAWLQKHPRMKLTGIVMGILTSFGFLYATNMGSHLLDLVDIFHSDFAALFVAYAQSSMTWVHGNEKCRQLVGGKAFFFFSIGYHVVVWVSNLANTVIFQTGNDLWLAWAVQGVIILIGLPIVFVVPLFLVDQQKCKESGLTTRNQIAKEIYIGPLERMRSVLNETACKGAKVFRVGLIWTLLIKFLVPLASSHLWLKAFNGNKLDMPGLPYGSYAWYWVAMGAFLPVVQVCLIIAGFIYPAWMDFLLPSPEVRPILVADDKLIKELTTTASEIEDPEIEAPVDLTE